VLQAADILLYKAELVPVGHDQLQHLELARRIGRSFNHRWGKVFPECEPLVTATPKVPGLDGKPKMSKSQGNALPLNAFESDAKLWKYLRGAVTDPARVTREDRGNPDVCNMYTLHKEFSSETDLAWVREGCTTAGIGCVECKQKLAANMMAHFKPYAERRAALLANPQRVSDVLDAGAAKARDIAKRTMAEVHKKLGLWRPA
jgi:tryptophanyl-tRNA synthetase